MRTGLYKRETWREWYRISAPTDTRLQLSVSPEAARYLDTIDWRNIPIVKHYLKIGFDEIATGGASARFGFDGVASCQTTQEGWRKYLFCLQPIGQRPAGSTQPEINWKRAGATSATLTLLFLGLNYPDEGIIPEGEPPQLLTVDACGAGIDDSSCSIGADLSQTMRRWLEAKAPIKQWEVVEETVRKAYDTMSRGFGFGDGFSRHYCRAIVNEPAQLILDCPGDACGLYVDGMFNYENHRDLPLDCHKVDCPQQQIALLMGLAKICDLYRAEQAK